MAISNNISISHTMSRGRGTRRFEALRQETREEDQGIVGVQRLCEGAKDSQLSKRKCDMLER